MRFIFQAAGYSKTPCCMVRGIMERIRGLPKKSLQGMCDANDGCQGYRHSKERGYDHYAVDHREGGYATDERNELRINNCECRIGLLER